MGTKRLQIDSAYDAYDINNDGIVSDKELSQTQRLIDIDNKDKKEDQQRRIALLAMISMLVVTGILLTPIIGVDRVEALSDLIGLFYIAMAGIIAAFFGSTAYMNVNR